MCVMSTDAHSHVCSTLEYPRCSQVSSGVYQTDCGSTAWAFSMFIAWNLLSMVRAYMAASVSCIVDFFSSTSSSICLLVWSWIVFHMFSSPLVVP